MDFVAKQELDTTALASASYTTPVIFTYSEGVIKKDTVNVASVRSVPSLRIANNLTGRPVLPREHGADRTADQPTLR